MSALVQDVRDALRATRRGWRLSLVIIASLALGIGANSAVFSVINGLLIKPFPYPDPEALAVLWLRSPGINIPQDWPSPGQYLDVRNENRSFEEMSISQGRSGTILLPDAQPVHALLTSSSLFRLLGARAHLGRLLLADEDVPGRRVAVLSYGFWQRVFGAAPDIVGRQITLKIGVLGTGDFRDQFEVIGVLSRDFLLNEEIMPTVGSIQQMDLFINLPLDASAQNERGDENYNLMARLKPGVTFAQAKADVAAIAGRIRDKDKRDRTFTIDVVPLVDNVVGSVRVSLLVLLGAVASVLLIACANVANLLLTRATRRQKEVAVRLALGASWQRLVRQLLTESVVLSVIGGASGLAVAAGALQFIRATNPGNIPRLEGVGLDPIVLLFTLGVSVLTGLIFGLVPAWRASRVDLTSSLKSGGRATHGDGGLGSARHRLRSLLVVAEVAVALVLLVGAGLLVRSFVRLHDVPPGFEPAGLASMQLGYTARPLRNRDEYQAADLELRDRIMAVPGISMHGSVSSLPFTSSVGWTFLNVEGWTPQPGQELQTDQRWATPDYFQAMQIPLVQGRYFTLDDLRPAAPSVVIVDEPFARRFWPAGDALGKRLWNDPERKATIVGVVGMVRQYGLQVEPRIVMYRPTTAAPYHVARTTSDPAAVASAMVKAVREFDPTITAFDVRTMSERMDGSLARQRFSTTMLSAFAGLALLLAVLGVYGVLSHLVAQGAHDIGVRMAIGAGRASILRLVMRQGLALVGAGIVIGLAGAAALSRVLASLLYGVSPTDVITFGVVPAILLTTAAVASYVPARRATRVDPVVALRDE